MGANCSSVAFGLIRTECESTNKLLSISDTVIENVTNIMSSTSNQVVTQLNISQTIVIRADRIACDNLNAVNRVSVDVVVNQEINEEARSQLIAAISNVTEWDAIQENRELTGWFSNPAASQVNDVEVANYFRALTEQTLTVERLNSITNSMYVDQQIDFTVKELTGRNCNIGNDVMVKVFVSQALYAVLDAFQNSNYDLETNLKLKQALERENRGIFESFFGSKKGKFTAVAVVFGAVMSSKKKGSSGGSGTTIIAPAPQPAPITSQPRTPSSPSTPSVPSIPQIPVNGTVQVPINGTVQIPVVNGDTVPLLGNVNGNGRLNGVNGGRVTGRLYTQNSRQPT